MRKKTIIVTLITSCITMAALFTLRSSDSGEEINPATKVLKSTTISASVAKQQNNMTEHKKRIKGIYRQDQPDMFRKFHQEIRTAAGEMQPSYKTNYKLIELNKARQKSSLAKRAAHTITWTERGPGNVSGRTRGLIFDPTDAGHNTWFAGSAGGGIWKTIDAGKSWEDKTEDLPNLSTTTLAICTSNPDILYAGTGEGFHNSDAIHGNGIFKSVNHGETWSQLPSTTINRDFRHVNRIIVDPKNADLVIACTNSSGIQKSIDGGSSWTQVYSTNRRVQQLLASPTTFDTLYATVHGRGVLRSTDRGDTWTMFSSGIESRQRIEIAIAATNPNVLYIAVENGEDSDLYISEDKGETWTMIIKPDGKNVAWLSKQGWYDNTIAVHPFKQNTVYVGGVDIWEAKLQAGVSTTIGLTGVEQNNTKPFLGFVNFGGAFLRGGMDIGKKGLGASEVDSTDYTTVEIRFGSGKKQKAHRFIRDDGSYPYQDYIDVPFEVWDVDNNIQLMVSFGDHKADSSFNLAGWEGKNPPREYIFVHAIPYSEVADTAITRANGFKNDRGVKYKCLYFIWPQLADGANWDPNNLPESNLRINWETIIRKHASFKRLTYWHKQSSSANYAHADHHNLQLIPTGIATFRMVDGNDGGVAYTDNAGDTWNQTLSGYNTTQFYGVDKKPGADEYIGGMQDNGTWQSPRGSAADKNSKYTKEIGGDGYDTAWNYKEATKIIGSLYYNRFEKSTDGGSTWKPATKGLEDAGEKKGPFITVLGKTKSDPDLLFCTGTSGVWRTDNFGEDWTRSEINEKDWGYSGSHTPIEVSIADQRIVWAGAYMSATRKIQVSIDGGATFTSTNNYKNIGRITGLASHPVEPQTAYATVSGSGRAKILRTKDLGQTWEDITGFNDNDSSSTGFPDVAVYDVLVMPYNTDILWACTEIGIFESVDDGASWALLDEDDFPAAAVWQADIVDDQVVIATHGRGIWTATIAELTSYSPPELTLTPQLKSIGQSYMGLSLSASLRSEYDSTQVVINDSVYAVLPATGILDTLISVQGQSFSEVKVWLKSFVNNESYSSARRSENIMKYNPVQAAYACNFDGSADDFILKGFTIGSDEGFRDDALHSRHPYVNRLEFYTILRTPIVVASENAVLKYKDVAIVEPGDKGTVWGDSKFWDYVIVEASKDGIEWKPLIDGYDAGFNAVWKQKYDDKSIITGKCYVDHTLNLLDKFEAGDVIIIRFRLFADTKTNAWGWVIDNLDIQPGNTAVDEANSAPEVFKLSQNYPNPFNPVTNINFDLPEAAEVKLHIYDTLGRKVETLINKKMESGTHKVKWDAHKYSSGIYFYRIKAGKYTKTRKLMLLK